MGKGKLGRYCKQKIGWLIPEVWSKWWRKKKKLSKMRAYCESKSDVQRATCGCRRRKQAKANVGPKPDRAATFAKRKNAAMGGYMGPNISGKYAGVELSNPSYRKYYGKKIMP